MTAKPDPSTANLLELASQAAEQEAKMEAKLKSAAIAALALSRLPEASEREIGDAAAQAIFANAFT